MTIEELNEKVVGLEARLSAAEVNRIELNATAAKSREEADRFRERVTTLENYFSFAKAIASVFGLTGVGIIAGLFYLSKQGVEIQNQQTQLQNALAKELPDIDKRTTDSLIQLSDKLNSATADGVNKLTQAEKIATVDRETAARAFLETFAKNPMVLDLKKYLVQKGQIAAFVSAKCPDNWNSYTPAQGRYIVGVQDRGAAEALVGEPLLDRENRATGDHSIKLNYVGLTHGPVKASSLNDTGPNNNGMFPFKDAPIDGQVQLLPVSGPFAGVQGQLHPGTNAPYVQLLICEKS